MKRAALVLVIILCCFTAGAIRNVDCAIENCTDLVGLYHLDDVTSTIIDSAGIQNGEAANGATVGSEGVIGTGVFFDGINDVLRFDHTTAHLPGGTGFPWTVAAWIKTNNLTQYQPIAFKGNNIGIAGGRSNWEFTYRPAGVGLQWIYTENGNGNQMTSALFPNDTEWHHIGISVENVMIQPDSSDSSRVFFLDGVPVLAVHQTNTGTPTMTTTEPLRIGAANTAEDLTFSGNMDEVVIYNRSLSRDEMRRLYNLGVMPLNATTQFLIQYGTTNFANVTNMSAVTGMVLATENGSITWNNAVDARLDDYDTHVRIGSGFVSVNTSALDTSANTSVNVSVAVETCERWTLYHASSPVASLDELVSSGTIIGTGTGTNGTCLTLCSNPVCTNNVVNFTIEHLDAAGARGIPGSVPEFSSYALLALLGIVIMGITIQRKSAKSI